MSDLTPVVLLVLLGAALVSGTGILLLIRHWRRKEQASAFSPADSGMFLLPEFGQPSAFTHRPPSWLVVRSRDPHAVQSALGLSNPRPCSWIEGLAGEKKLFIAPPVHGWILIVGSGLPDPTEDVDVCFRFLLDLSRKLGQVQFFGANPVLGHHAWVKVDSGRVVRAYVWAGKTLWNQGIKTREELQLGLKTLHYLETPASQSEALTLNTERVPQLAARWSFDPAAVDEHVLDHTCGIAGD